MLEIPQVFQIIKIWGLSKKTEIKNILKMAWRTDITVDVINKTPIKEDGRKKRYQTSKYTTLKNGAYYVHHNWDKNHRVK